MSMCVKCDESPLHVGIDLTLQVSLRSASWENAFEHHGTPETRDGSFTRQINFMIIYDPAASPAHL